MFGPSSAVVSPPPVTSTATAPGAVARADGGTAACIAGDIGALAQATSKAAATASVELVRSMRTQRPDMVATCVA
jgi:hypothetical protein